MILKLLITKFLAKALNNIKQIQISFILSCYRSHHPISRNPVGQPQWLSFSCLSCGLQGQLTEPAPLSPRRTAHDRWPVLRVCARRDRRRRRRDNVWERTTCRTARIRSLGGPTGPTRPPDGHRSGCDLPPRIRLIALLYTFHGPEGCAVPHAGAAAALSQRCCRGAADSGAPVAFAEPDGVTQCRP